MQKVATQKVATQKVAITKAVTVVLRGVIAAIATEERRTEEVTHKDSFSAKI